MIYIVHTLLQYTNKTTPHRVYIILAFVVKSVYQTLKECGKFPLINEIMKRLLIITFTFIDVLFEYYI